MLKWVSLFNLISCRIASARSFSCNRNSCYFVGKYSCIFEIFTVFTKTSHKTTDPAITCTSCINCFNFYSRNYFSIWKFNALRTKGYDSLNMAVKRPNVLVEFFIFYFIWNKYIDIWHHRLVVIVRFIWCRIEENFNIRIFSFCIF